MHPQNTQTFSSFNGNSVIKKRNSPFCAIYKILFSFFFLKNSTLENNINLHNLVKCEYVDHILMTLFETNYSHIICHDPFLSSRTISHCSSMLKLLSDTDVSDAAIIVSFCLFKKKIHTHTHSKTILMYLNQKLVKSFTRFSPILFSLFFFIIILGSCLNSKLILFVFFLFLFFVF